ncbi:hypothetical protein H0264_08920 [Nocardia huaxiensis]|uniref:Uncharacterized protein n=1 Tax=Nocardia huaxiensis TaxID=2755382 RepID=A0A7D6VL89_9NOCA|nr:hypothetical protein [Nocardia huaxiensis]QLY32356.1 hypothetical protein H0264_08920 [Nocardia huaxiensis]
MKASEDWQQGLADSGRLDLVSLRMTPVDHFTAWFDYGGSTGLNVLGVPLVLIAVGAALASAPLVGGGGFDGARSRLRGSIAAGLLLVMTLIVVTSAAIVRNSQNDDGSMLTEVDPAAGLWFQTAAGAAAIAALAAIWVARRLVRSENPEAPGSATATGHPQGE